MASPYAEPFRTPRPRGQRQLDIHDESRMLGNKPDVCVCVPVRVLVCETSVLGGLRVLRFERMNRTTNFKTYAQNT